MHTDDCHLSMLEWNRMKYLFECISKPLYIYLYIYKKKNPKKQMDGCGYRCNEAICKKQKKKPQSCGSHRRRNEKSANHFQTIFQRYFFSFWFCECSKFICPTKNKNGRAGNLTQWKGGGGAAVGGLQLTSLNEQLLRMGDFFFFFPSAGRNRRPDCFLGGCVFGGPECFVNYVKSCADECASRL